ncbi:hypothetical protein ABIB95_005854 [Bradyrhizobium sp. LA2.1]
MSNRPTSYNSYHFIVICERELRAMLPNIRQPLSG